MDMEVVVEVKDVDEVVLLVSVVLLDVAVVVKTTSGIHRL